MLLRLWACPRCAGLGESVRPCQGYCLNVLRGCVTERASDLDQPWASFVEAAAKLAGSAAAAPAFPGRPSTALAAPYQLNAEEAIRQMENKISEAIMFAMEHGVAVERKVSFEEPREGPAENSTTVKMIHGIGTRATAASVARPRVCPPNQSGALPPYPRPQRRAAAVLLPGPRVRRGPTRRGEFTGMLGAFVSRRVPAPSRAVPCPP